MVTMRITYNIRENVWTKTGSGEPFIPFEYHSEQADIIGEADFFHSGGFERIKVGDYAVDGRFFFAIHKKRENTILFYPDKSGFVKPFIKINDQEIVVTTFPEDLYQSSSKFSPLGAAFFMELGYVPPPLSLYQGWQVIPPGFFAKVHLQKKTLSFHRWWQFSSIKETFTPSAFWDLFSSHIQKYQEPTSLMLSGGIDSRLIAFSTDKPKSSFFLKQANFIPEEEDATIINTYPKKFVGKFKEVVINLDSEEVVRSFEAATLQGIDHAHMGWKLHTLLKEAGKTNRNDIFLTGQSADVLLMKNLPGEHLNEKLHRGLYSNFARGLSLPGIPFIIRGLSRLLPDRKRKKLRSLVAHVGRPSYLAGIIFQQGLPGSENQRILEEWLIENILKEEIETYGPNLHFAVTDLLLRTHLWGMDMRVIEDAAKAAKIKIRYPYNHEEIMQYIINIPFMQNNPFGQYKRFFKRIFPEVHQVPIHSFSPTLKPGKDHFMDLEEKLEASALGKYFLKTRETAQYREFTEMVRDELKISTESNDFIYQQRLISLFLLWKACKI